MIRAAIVTALKRRLKSNVFRYIKLQEIRISTPQLTVWNSNFEYHKIMQILFFLITYVSAWSMGKHQIKNIPVQAVFRMSIAHHAKTEILQRQKRSCFSHGKILNFRNALRKTNMKLTYQQMVQLIHNHAICVNGICIACGENYVYKIERQWIFLVQLIISLTFSFRPILNKKVYLFMLFIYHLVYHWNHNQRIP